MSNTLLNNHIIISKDDLDKLYKQIQIAHNRIQIYKERFPHKEGVDYVYIDLAEQNLFNARRQIESIAKK